MAKDGNAEAVRAQLALLDNGQTIPEKMIVSLRRKLTDFDLPAIATMLEEARHDKT